MIQVFASGGQSTGTSASASVLPMNIQDWFPLGLTGLMSLLSKGLSRVFPSNTVVKRPFSSAQSSLWSNSILTALYYKPGPVGGGWDTVRILIINWVREERSVSNCSLMQGEYGLGVLVVPHRERVSSFHDLSRLFPMSQFFPSGGQSIGASASASVLPMNIQDWFPLGLTGLISLQSKGLSRVFSNTTVQKHQFFRAQLSSWSNSHIHTWLLEKPELWLDGPLLSK